MKRRVSTGIIFCVIILFLIGGCSQQKEAFVPETKKQTITDMAGRKVEVPTSVDQVYSTSATGSVFLYTLAPEKLAGWNDVLNEKEKKYVAPEYLNLPNLGRWKGTSPTGSIEDLLKAHPDIIISVGDVSPDYIGDAEIIQKQTGIPVIMIDGSMQNTAEAYRFLGGLIGESERAKELADYCDKTLNEVSANLQSLLDEGKTQVYYAEGTAGLETEISGTVNSEAFDLAGAKNVAIPVTAGVRRMQVSIEQILVWDPDVIVISTDGSSNHAVYEKILHDSAWSNIRAVKNGEVYEVPCGPYDWINRPPSVVRFIGVKWLSGLLYPDVITTDIRQDISEFYSLFFNHKISDMEINALLATSIKK